MSWSTEDHTYQDLCEQSDARIVFLVFDGLGDIPGREGTPLEAARTPNLDRLASEGASGLFDPVAPGITPGSGPGHLGLFGYDPLEVQVGRGVLSALGVDFPLEKRDVAARFNFCTLDSAGRITDRRAGRIPTDENRRIMARLREEIDLGEGDVDLFLETESEHRGLLVLRGEALGAGVSDTDPQATGVPPLQPGGSDPASRHTAELVSLFLAQARELLADEAHANGILLRGFDQRPDLPTLGERFQLRPACLAQYPMYRGLARLVGMEILEPPSKLDDFPAALGACWEGRDFFFLHVKYTDKAGEDGSFERKQSVIEEVDRLIPALLEPGPEVVVVSADHSTPAAMRSHSWHPVPALLWAPATVRRDDVTRFGETSCAGGGLGHDRLRYLLPLALAHAGKLKKFGA